jgi:large subunit ribosomal protein L11
MEFCKAFNARTQKDNGVTLPTIITVYSDRTFTFITKTPPVTYLVKDKIKLESGSKKPGHEVAGTVQEKVVEEVAKVKMPHITAASMDAAKRTVEGSIRSIGLYVAYKEHTKK